MFAIEISDDFINEINTKQNLWAAGRNFPVNFPVEKLFGLKRDRDIKNVRVVRHEIDESVKIPEAFDARSNWSQCNCISQVPDQSACASSWVNKINAFTNVLVL